MIYSDIILCFTWTTLFVILGILSSILLRKDPGFLYREIHGLEDKFKEMPKDFRHDVRKFLVDKRDLISNDDISGEQLKLNLTKEVYEELIKQLKEEIKLWGYYWHIYFGILLTILLLNIYKVNKKFYAINSVIKKERIERRYKSRDCLKFANSISNFKYFATWRINDTIFVSSIDSDFTNWKIYNKTNSLNKSVTFDRPVTICPCYQDTFRIYDYNGKLHKYLTFPSKK